MGNNYEKIVYPLNKINNLIQKDNIFCNNYRIPDHSNIEIIYEKENNPFVYRCPIYLFIPFLYYYNGNIIYKCGCGVHKCSIDSFFINFPSYPIETIIYKNNEITEAKYIKNNEI